MQRYDGALAKQLDFNYLTRFGPRAGRLAAGHLGRPRQLRGPGKYKVLETRRRRAQINARRLLDLID
jgi:hypothetical protein